MPWATPPWTMPWTIIGLTMVPQSSTATYLTILARPVSVSTSTTQTCAPDGQVVGEEGREGDVRDRLGPVGRAPDPQHTLGELDVLLGHLELVSGDLPGLGDDLLGRLLHGHAAGGQAATAVGVQALGRDRGVAVQDLDVFEL